jgi:hypothetical protein
MGNVYFPYEILATEEGELLVLVEPDEHLSSIIEDRTEDLELDVDVDYDEEDEELYILMTIYIEDSQVFFGLPYGESWDYLIDKASFSVAFVSEKDFKNKKYGNAPILSVEFDDITLGFVEGCKKTADALLGEEDFE